MTSGDDFRLIFQELYMLLQKLLCQLKIIGENQNRLL